MLDLILTREEIKEIEAIRDLLISSDAIRCDIESYVPLYSEAFSLFRVPSGHHVQINYNKMAYAIYKAGYKKKNYLEKDSTLSEKLRYAQKNNIELGGINDIDTIHSHMDQLIIEELESLGYTESAKIFREQKKWYG